MKLRYYLRGLGIGMLVTTLILVLSGNAGNSMTDDEVKRRAAQLGMVEETKKVLSDLETLPEETTEEVLEESQEEEAQEEITVKEPEVSKEVADIEASDIETSEKKPDVSKEENSEQAQIEELKKAADEVAQKAQNLNPEGMVTLLVQSGDSSVTVAKRAEAAGLVESAMAFDRFLCQNGYDKSICVGSYEVPLGAGEEEIAKIITRR